MHRDTGRPYPCEGCEGVPTLTEDIRESWELFARAATRERRKDAHGNEWEQFSVKWEFVNTYLTHVAVEDPEQALDDLVTIVRDLNA